MRSLGLGFTQCLVLIGCFAVLSGNSFAAGAALSLRQEPDQVVVSVNDKVFTVYKTMATQKYPYFFPVNAPGSGESVTTETSEPYPHHHSLFFGCDRVNDGNYWQDANGRGQILSQGPKIVQQQGEKVQFTDVCLWKQPDQEPIIRDARRVTISAPEETVRCIDFEIAMEMLTDIVIEQTNHSLFSARMHPTLSVTGGGLLINAEGAKNEAGTFGQASVWCDYSGLRNGITEGLAILQHPGNPWYPSKWFTRDYGFFSPTPMYWPEGGRFTFPKGKTITLKYRVLVHSGDAAAAKIAERFAVYEKE